MNYEKQATDFLEKTNTVFSSKYLKTDKHFEGDREKRDIYEITLKREGRIYTFNFGDSIHNTEKWTRINPSAYDVLSCLVKYDVGTFVDFCGEFGYDEDSRKAEKVYHDVKEEYTNVQVIWNDSEIEELQEIN